MWEGEIGTIRTPVPPRLPKAETFIDFASRSPMMNTDHILAFLSLGATSLWCRSLCLFPVLSGFVE